MTHAELIPAQRKRITRDMDGSVVATSTPYPTRDEAAAALDFVLQVVNGTHPIRFEGSAPWLRPGGPGYVPPEGDDAVTVRVLPPPSSAAGVWRLQAGHPRGYVMATSRSYPTRQAAAGALDFLGTLSVLAGDPKRTGQVKGTTLPTDLVCDCQQLGAACLHFETANSDARRPGSG